MRLLPLLLILLTPSSAFAEYKQIELKIFGMDCATCAHGIRIAVQRVAGVETVELSLERASATIRLTADNQVSIDQLRQIVKRNGFEPKEAIVTAVGQASEAAGRLTFVVTGVAGTLAVSPKSDPTAVSTITGALAAKRPAAFEVAGTVQKLADGTEELTIATARLR